jgi:putative peptide zinc metalloprotease protein
MRFDLRAGRDGRWLVIDGDRRFVVPAEIGRSLHGPSGPARWRSLVAGADPAVRRRGSLWLRLPILPARVVDRLAGRLGVLAGWWVQAGMVVLGLVGMASAPSTWPGDPGTLLLAAALFVLSGVWHELGHAAALRREGWAPGAIGAGLLWILPVLWSDVTATTLLPRAGRVRVDVAGVAFQAGFIGVVGLVATLVGWPAGGAVVRAGWVAILWSLLPLVRSDGHWLVCDLLGLQNLTAPAPPSLGRRGRRVLAVWRGTAAMAVVALLGLLITRLVAVAATRMPTDSPAGWAAIGLGSIVLVLGIGRAIGRLGRLVRAMRRDWTSARRSPGG